MSGIKLHLKIHTRCHKSKGLPSDENMMIVQKKQLSSEVPGDERDCDLGLPEESGPSHFVAICILIRKYSG
jgi:hypothetical protein